MTQAEPQESPHAHRIGGRPIDRVGVICGVSLCVAVSGLLVGGVLISRSHGARLHGAEINTYVDAKLVRFGKPRDLSFLPHVQATPKPHSEKKVLKLADDPDRPHKDLPRPPEEPPKETNLSKIADQFKNLRQDEDDRATREAAEEGSLSGSRGGTATEASGDPFIREIMAAVTERWTVPSLLTPGELSRLKATACLKIDDDGRLVKFEIIEKSNNDLFDGSLNTTLGSITTLPKPYGKFAGAARRGKLCPEFTKG